eukprot:5116129-Karenia_brevis.AAC.1
MLAHESAKQGAETAGAWYASKLVSMFKMWGETSKMQLEYMPQISTGHVLSYLPTVIKSIQFGT